MSQEDELHDEDNVSYGHTGFVDEKQLRLDIRAWACGFVKEHGAASVGFFDKLADGSTYDVADFMPKELYDKWNNSGDDISFKTITDAIDAEAERLYGSL